MFSKSKERKIEEIKQKQLQIIIQEGKTKYEVGLYNGIEICLSILQNRDPSILTPDVEKEEKREEKGRTLYGNMKRNMEG